jgi:flagellar L-ring protein precursor FlgH
MELVKRCLLARVCLAVACGQSPGSLFVSSGALSDPARDVRAGRVGDIVTIVVADQATASAAGGTNTARQSAGNGQVSALAGTLAAGNPLTSLMDFSNERKLQGQGQTTRATTLVTTISARVVAVTLNGLLVVEGTKETAVNAERQRVVVRGLIRPYDLTPANTIRSDQVADLTLEVNGKGVVEDAIKRPFLLYRILTGFLPF